MTLQSTQQGKVWLIGAGPGDPELLTLKAFKTLQKSTIWLVDDLVSEAIVDLAPPSTQVIYVGKRGGCLSTPQAFILRLMARYAEEGHQVARVKGGDPFIFGRGGEEWAWLAQRGIEVEALSGITAGLAVGSALGLPLTHRAVARGVAFITAHTVNGERPDWTALAKSHLTLVCYMGMRQLADLQAEWLAAGFSPHLPVAVVHRVSTPEQRHLLTQLGQLDTAVKNARLKSPSVIILGEAVASTLQATPLWEHAEHVG